MSMKTKKQTAIFVVLAMLVLGSIFMTGCIGNDGTEEVRVEGSSTVLPIAQSAAEEFNDEHDDIRVTVSGGGSGYGISGIIEGTIEIGMASRSIREDEKEKVPNVKEHTVGKDGLAIIVSETLHNEGLTELTQEEVRKIYSGEITNWGEVGGPDEDTYIVERADTSGTYGVFMDFMGLEDTAADSTQQENSDVRRTVAGSDYAIGYVGLGYIQDDAPAVKLDGVEPTFENVADGSYPLFRELYFYTNGEPEGATAEFIDFVMSERGQEIVEEAGFVPVDA